jgi:hypothetical protein
MNRRRVGGLPPLQLPPPRPPVLNPAAFCPVPVACPDPALASWQMDVYRQAFALAEALLRPSLRERDLAGVWN